MVVSTRSTLPCATFTNELKKLVAWFKKRSITTVAMEATVVYWKTPCEKPQKPKPRPLGGCPVGYDERELLGAPSGMDLTPIPVINANTA
jgi:hypothetical protein